MTKKYFSFLTASQNNLNDQMQNSSRCFYYYQELMIFLNAVNIEVLCLLLICFFFKYCPIMKLSFILFFFLQTFYNFQNVNYILREVLSHLQNIILHVIKIFYIFRELLQFVLIYIQRVSLPPLQSQDDGINTYKFGHVRSFIFRKDLAV